jgi:cobalamin-dependent methionine synthase I
MVAGAVTPPRMDLINEELLLSHLHASVLSICSIEGLNSSIGEIIDTDNLEKLPLKESVVEALKLTDKQKTEVLKTYLKVLEDASFQEELKRRNPVWFNEEWMMRGIDEFLNSFDRSLNRWRLLYRNAIQQFRNAN